jgi:hypothetical protein
LFLQLLSQLFLLLQDAGDCANFQRLQVSSAGSQLVTLVEKCPDLRSMLLLLLALLRRTYTTL